MRQSDTIIFERLENRRLLAATLMAKPQSAPLPAKPLPVVAPINVPASPIPTIGTTLFNAPQSLANVDALLISAGSSTGGASPDGAGPTLLEVPQNWTSVDALLNAAIVPGGVAASYVFSAGPFIRAI
jgi:hypothetical protein